jgi:hypothetical protein
MSDERASATPPVKPVTSYENQDVKNMALSVDYVFEMDLAEISKLRKQQADYLASLPVDPAECLSEALRTLQSNGKSYPDGFEEAFYLSFALEPMIRDLDGGSPCPERDAMLYVADRVRQALMRFMPKLDHVNNVLCSPGRVKRHAARS